MKFNVMCKVSGGVTGTRQGLLKHLGKVVEFDTLAEADAEARMRATSTNGNPYRTADFVYWPVPAQS